MPAKQQTGDIATFAIKVDGKTIPDQFRVYSVTVENHVNRISYAKVVILDGQADTASFDASSSASFLPGASLVIEAGYDTQNKQIFKGIITRQRIRIDNIIGSALEVECRDEAIKMTVGRKSKVYADKKDSDIISSIIGNYSGLSASVSATTTKWAEQVQYYATDWDFIVVRAEANGMIVTTIDSKVSVKSPADDTTSVCTVGYGTGLLEFNADLNSITQLGSVKASSWDFTQQQLVNATSSESLAGPGNLSCKKLSEVVGLSDFQLQSTAPLVSADLTEWTKAQLVKSGYSKIRGEAKFQGTSLVKPATYITLEGLGTRFNGDHFVSGVVHTIEDGNWTTEAIIGLSASWFAEDPDVMSPPAAGLLPAAGGLFNGTVKKMSGDPDNQFRILVNIPLFDNSGEGVWARLSNFYSTSNAGAFFLPEVGDEVVIGFLNNDPRFPIILGSMYSSSKIKPFNGLTPDEKNPKKAIVSKSGIYIQFDDEKKILTINTPSNNQVVLDDDQKKITMKDQHSNSIEMSADGITIKSPKNITIQADQQVSIKGTQGISAQSSGGDIQLKGMNIKENADMQYSAQGGQSAQVTGGMQLTLKGAMVMIN